MILKVVQQVHDHSEGAKHLVDAIAVGGGLAAVVAHWLEIVINPLLTAMVMIATIIWTYYRIQEIRSNLHKKDD